MFTAFFVLGQLFSVYPEEVPIDLNFALLMVGEILLGLMMGLFLNVIMAIFQTAGEFFSVQMGLAIAQGVDPSTNIPTPLLGQLFNLIALYVFLSINGFQKLFIGGILRSFEVVQAVDLMKESQYYAAFWISILGQLFVSSFLLALPILGVLLLLSVVLGLLSRTAPQMNLLILGLPLQLSLGIVLLGLAMPQIVQMIQIFLDRGFGLLWQFFSPIIQSPTV